ncbi:type II toxin-antitoxin system VapC family toxin [Candidatus Roizmanbacteria bacterium]|nr:type II toxin-antitoxin system VapC family toxin [Candidatus Roizmanbacteria bacterium]
MRVFIDTSAFISYFRKDATYHSEVSEKLDLYQKTKTRLFTSDYVLDELFTWFVSRYHRSLVEKIFVYLQRAEIEGEIKVLFIDRHVFKKTQALFLKFSEHKISFTDAVSYVLYKDFKMDEIFTLDRDFKKLRLKTSF